MYYCPECDETYEEPGNWNAKTKKFLCGHCLSNLVVLQEVADTTENVMTTHRESPPAGKKYTAIIVHGAPSKFLDRKEKEHVTDLYL